MKKRKKGKISRQLHSVYIIALLIPLLVIGSVLIFSARQTLKDYYIQMLETDNSRVHSLLREITTQAYRVSTEICYDSTVKQLLSREYTDGAEFATAVDGYSGLEMLTYNTAEIAKIYIYTDNPTVKDHGRFRYATEEVQRTDWYQKSITSSAFWTTISGDSESGASNNLCLVRKVPLSNSPYFAVTVIQVSDTYIRSRMESSNIIDMVSVDDQGIVYGSSTSRYGEAIPVTIDYAQPYYRSSGTEQIDGKQYFYAVSTINLYNTNSRMYVCTLDSTGVTDIRNLTMTWLVILALALAVPLVIVTVYAMSFSRRIRLLRGEMHKASQQDYDIITDFGGNDELAETFEDLKIMVQDIKEKDARMYEAELKEQELLSKQQLMEYKMLSSQINPHYLYNTLETIRMKALTEGDRAVADAIKVFGKTLHYVQESTDTAFTTLQQELDHVESYLTVQKLRFGDRINYRLQIQPGIEPENQSIVPLLLQPVVENAVVHGLELVDGTGEVTVEIFRENGKLHIHVRDNGLGMSREQLQAVTEGINAPQQPRGSIALYNIHQRIRLRYGEEYGLRVQSHPGQGTCVCLCIPAQ